MHLPWRLVFCTVGFIYTHRFETSTAWPLKVGGGFCLCEPHTAIRGCAVANAGRCSRRAYPIAEPANLGIPIVGRFLTMCGALILPDKLSQMVKFQRAMKKRLDQHQRVFVYPEAHVWPYYTRIRPFPVGAFHYPVAENVPSYTMTITYQKSRLLKRPKQVIYFDGPFMPDMALSRKSRQRKLHDQVYDQMVLRSRESNVAYIHYERQTDD